MSVHIGLMFASLLPLAFVQSTPYSLASYKGCFEHNIHYIGLGLPQPGGNNNYGPTYSAEGCQSLCQQTDGCGWFNWEGEDKCWLKMEKGNQTKQKLGGVTGPRMCPKAYEMCGFEKKYDGKHRRIIGGSITRPNQYPWMVRIYPPGCGGSLITDRHVLTAKHCVVNSIGKSKLGKYVKVSVHNRSDPDDYELVPIKTFVLHTADMAIIILERQVNLTDETIGTVCLPTSANQHYGGKIATAIGWGMTYVGSPHSPVLKHVNLKVLKRQEENWLYTENKVINGVPQDPCSGDSGGPLVHRDVESGRWTIIGTLKGGGYNCNLNITIVEGGIWNKVTDHLAWIHTVIGN